MSALPLRLKLSCEWYRTIFTSASFELWEQTIWMFNSGRLSKSNSECVNCRNYPRQQGHVDDRPWFHGVQSLPAPPSKSSLRISSTPISFTSTSTKAKRIQSNQINESHNHIPRTLSIHFLPRLPPRPTNIQNPRTITPRRLPSCSSSNDTTRWIAKAEESPIPPTCSPNLPLAGRPPRSIILSLSPSHPLHTWAADIRSR